MRVLSFWKGNRTKLAVTALLFVSIILLNCLLGFMLAPWTLADELQYDLDDIKSEGKNVTCIVLGDSACRAEIDPIVLDSTLNRPSLTINASYNGQLLTSEQYNLMDCIANNPVDTVVIALNYYQLTTEGTTNSACIVLDRIKSPIIYAKALDDLTDNSNPFFALKAFRYRDNIKDIPAIVDQKMQPETVKRSKKTSYRGFEAMAYNGIEGGADIFESDIRADQILDKHVGAVKNMIQYCKARNIDVYLFALPLATSTLVTWEDSLSEIHNTIHAVAEESGVPFYDLNLMRDRQDILKNGETDSLEHMNGIAAPRITERMGEIINIASMGEDANRYLYDDMQQAVNALSGVVAMHVSAERDSEDSVIVQVNSITAQTEEVLYEYGLMRGQEIIILQDFTKDDQFVLNAAQISQGDRIYVNAKTDEGPYMWRSLPCP